jgi:hypothetical protein
VDLVEIDPVGLEMLEAPLAEDASTDLAVQADSPLPLRDKVLLAQGG